MNQERAERFLPLARARTRADRQQSPRAARLPKGDFDTPEQRIPDTGIDGDWETCMTMNHTWGYKSYDHDWKSTDTLLTQSDRHRVEGRQLSAQHRPQGGRHDPAGIDRSAPARSATG